MDAISYSYADKQAKRIKKFNENPDSASGILTQPSVIQAGETVTIPSGRTAIMANTVIDGTINLDGTIFIPSGATTDDIDAQLALKAPLENPVFTSAISTKDVNYKSTPVSITSWSYSGTTVTLNVASHSYTAGDYVEVSGLTATTYPANGIQLVTSITSTTIVFTLSVTPTGTAGVSSATVKGYATINGRVSLGLGINQNWQDISGKAFGVTYKNTSGRAKNINVRANAGGIANTLVLIVDGFALDVSYAYASGIIISVFGMIPAGSNYRVDNTGGSLQNWRETV